MWVRANSDSCMYPSTYWLSSSPLANSSLPHSLLIRERALRCSTRNSDMVVEELDDSADKHVTGCMLCMFMKDRDIYFVLIKLDAINTFSICRVLSSSFVLLPGPTWHAYLDHCRYHIHSIAFLTSYKNMDSKHTLIGCLPLANQPTRGAELVCWQFISPWLLTSESYILVMTVIYHCFASVYIASCSVRGLFTTHKSHILTKEVELQL